MKTFTTPLQNTLAPDAPESGVDELALSHALPERTDAAADRFAFVVRAACLSGNGFDGIGAYVDDLIKRNGGSVAAVRGGERGQSKN